RQPLPDAWRAARHVLLAGVGNGALAAEFAAGLAAQECPVPLAVCGGYDLPASAGPATLVVALSPTGEDEATLSVAEAAWTRGTWLLAITGGGALAELGQRRGFPIWEWPAAARAGDAVAALSLLALGALAQLGFAGLDTPRVTQAVAALRLQQVSLQASTPVVHNPAKRLAGQLLDRLPLVFAAGWLAPVARYWKCQINLMAKAPALWDVVPEMDHNSVAGTAYPEALVSKFLVLALRTRQLPERARWLVDETRSVYMRAGFNTDAVDGSGPSPLAQALTTLHYGSYVAFYLAVCYGVDPAV
ncbi:MAG: hypothetical protein IT318_09475, partial [Anaerolineales bacterium]|nr:hypothetical protein [Anaerolineales bacterium]